MSIYLVHCGRAVHVLHVQAGTVLKKERPFKFLFTELSYCLRNRFLGVFQPWLYTAVKCFTLAVILLSSVLPLNFKVTQGKVKTWLECSLVQTVNQDLSTCEQE